MDAVDVLMEARAYIEKGWCQGTAGLSHEGAFLSDPKWMAIAVSVCSVGAIWKGTQTGLGWTAEADDAGELLREVLGWKSLADWNDTPGRTQEEVLEAFDRAIGLGLERAGER